MSVERLPVRHHERVAVLLNANAGAVSEALRRELENFVPPEDVFYSRTLEDARAIARTVLERGYSTVLTGGGDGTFVGYVNCLFEEASRTEVVVHGAAAVQLARHRFRVPRVGVLKLGTGNAVAEFCGSSARRVGVVEDILRARSGEVAQAREVHLLDCEGKLAPFAGLGIDAAVLNDYVRLKKGLEGGKLQFAGAGGLGYFLSIVGRTIPGYVLQRGVPQVEVVNLGAPARARRKAARPRHRARRSHLPWPVPHRRRRKRSLLRLRVPDVPLRSEVAGPLPAAHLGDEPSQDAGPVPAHLARAHAPRRPARLPLRQGPDHLRPGDAPAGRRRRRGLPQAAGGRHGRRAARAARLHPRRGGLADAGRAARAPVNKPRNNRAHEAPRSRTAPVDAARLARRATAEPRASLAASRSLPLALLVREADERLEIGADELLHVVVAEQPEPRRSAGLRLELELEI